MYLKERKISPNLDKVRLLQYNREKLNFLEVYKMKRVWDIIGQVLAIVLVFVYVLYILNLNFGFLDALPPVLTAILAYLKNFGSLALIAIVGLEATSRKPFIIKLLFLLLCAVVVVFMFFPATYDALISTIK